MKSANLIMSHQNLYSLIWEKPLKHLSKELEIDSKRLKQKCLDYLIPLPEVGHWVKLSFGKEVDKKPLPAHPELDLIEINLSSLKEELEEHILSRLSKRTKEIKDQFPQAILVPERLTNPDNLIMYNGAPLTPRLAQADPLM